MEEEGLGVMNENGELFADFCAQNDLVIGSTVFPHKRIHKLTWTSPDQTPRNQIDHMTKSRRWRRTTEDVRVYRGADAESDHEPEGATGEGTSNRTTTDKAFWHFQNLITRPTQWVLYCPAKQISNINRLGRALYKCQVGTDQNIIRCEENLGFGKKTYRSWLCHDPIARIEERRTIKSRLLQAKTRAQKQEAQKEYKEQKKEVWRSTRQDKRSNINQLTSSAQEAAIKNDTRNLYEITRKLSGRRSNSCSWTRWGNTHQTSGSTGTLEAALQSPPFRKASRTPTKHRSRWRTTYKHESLPKRYLEPSRKS